MTRGTEAVRRIRARIERFVATGDAAEIAGAGLQDDLAALAADPLAVQSFDVLHTLGWLYWHRGELPGTGGSEDRAKAEKLFEAVYVMDPETVPESLRDRLRDRRMSRQEEILSAIPDPYRPGRSRASPGAVDALTELSQVMTALDAYQRVRSTSALDDAAARLRRLRTAMSASDPVRRLVDGTFGLILCELHRVSGDPELLDECVTVLGSASSAGLPEDRGGPPDGLRALLEVLRHLHGHDPDPALVAELPELAKLPSSGGHTGTAPGMWELTQILAALAAGGSPDAQAAAEGTEATPGHPTGVAHGLGRAAEVARRALVDCPPGHPFHHKALLNLGLALGAIFEVNRDTGTLDECAAVLRRSLEATPPDDPDEAAARVVLGGVLAELADRRADPELTRESLRLVSEDRGRLDPGHPARLVIVAQRAAARLRAYRTTGAAEHLDFAITTGRALLAELAPAALARRPATVNLAIALRARHEHTGDLADLDEAVALLRDSARHPAAFGFDHAIAMHALATALIQYHVRTGAKDTTEEAVHWARQALRKLPGGGDDRAVLLVTLGQALADHAAVTHSPAAWSEALRVLRSAVAERLPDDPALPHAAGTLALTLLRRQGGQADGDARLGEAVDVLRQGAAVRVPTPERAACAALLGHVLRERGVRTGNTSDLSEAAQALLGALDQPLTAPRRVLALAALARVSADLRQWEEATRWWRSAADAMPAVAPARLAIADREFRLGLLAGLPSDAAACALWAGRTRLAVNLLERTRGMLAEQVGKAREPAEPTDAVLHEDVRSDGDVVAGLGAGPLVYVNLSPYRSDALIVSSGKIRTVPLPPTTHHDAARHAQAITKPDETTPEARGKPLAEARTWLWRSIAEPVMNALGFGPATGPAAQWPRVWWCPGGPLTTLPLHAAGLDDQPGASVAERVVSSYVTTGHALLTARAARRPARLTGEGILVVAMAATLGQTPLPGAIVEKDTLLELFPDATVLLNERATRDRVLGELPRHSIVHFACHVKADPVNASESRLLLADHRTRPLTLARLRELRLRGAALAYLSACETLRAPETLADQAAHLAAGCLLAGFPQVVGTLWKADDGACARLAAGFYAALAGFDLGVDSAAFALHQAVRDLRESGAEPYAWAAFVHMGA